MRMSSRCREQVKCNTPIFDRLQRNIDLGYYILEQRQDIENDSKREVFEKGVIIHLFYHSFIEKVILLPKERSLRYVLCMLLVGE
jgi:hypothetical protein